MDREGAGAEDAGGAAAGTVAGEENVIGALTVEEEPAAAGGGEAKAEAAAFFAAAAGAEEAAEAAEGSLRASRSMEPRSVSEGAAAARTEEEGRAGRRRCPRRAVAAVAPAALLARHGVDIIETCLSSISSFFPQRSVGSLLGIAAELISLSGSFERERTQGEPRARESGPRRKLAKSSDPPKPKPKAAALILLLARPGPLLLALVS